MKSYQEAMTVIKARDSKKLENNTYLVRDGQNLAVRLHLTNVVTYFPDGRICLESGGWRTVTTKDRINQYAPINLWQEKGQWFFSFNENQLTYTDGMTINPDGSFSGVMSAKDSQKEQKLRAQVRKYAKDYLKALQAGKVAGPSAGDCWYCALEEEKTGKPLGEMCRDGSHIRAHIKERYYVPSLAWNAAKAFGLGAYYQLNIAARQGLTDQAPIKSDFVDQTIEKSIRRYCYRELGLAY